MCPRRLVLFDLDETLFDHAFASRKALQGMRRRYPVLADVELDQLQNVARKALDTAHERLLSGSLTPAEARMTRIRILFETCGASLDDESLDRAATEYGKLYRGVQRSIPGAVALLGRLRTEVRIGVVTNHLTAVQIRKLDACGLSGFVEFMVTSDDAGYRKPAPEIFQVALAKGQALPSETVMVGDSWEGDVRGALSVGITPIWFNPNRLPQPPGSAVVELNSLEPAEAARRIIMTTP